MKTLISKWREEYLQFHSITQLPDSTQYVVLAIILAGVLIVRLLTINSPAIEWTAWKEIDYLYISRNFWLNGFNFFRPEVSWPAELPHVTEMELPLVPYLTAILYKVFGFNVLTARSVTLLSFVLMVIYVFKLSKRELGAFVGLSAALAAGILPLYHPYNRFLFTEPLMICMSVLSLYYTAEWVDHERRRDGVLALISLSLTFALKLESLYLLLPVGWIAFRKYKFRYSEYKRFVFLVLISLIVPIIWYAYAYYLENIGAHLFGIFRGHDKSQIVTMLTDFRWYRTMAGRVINGILGGLIGTVLFLSGILGMIVLRRGGLFFAYLFSIAIYFVLVAEGQADAPYRQMSLVPSAAIFIGSGSTFLLIALLAMIMKFKPSIEFKNSNHLASLGLCLLMVLLIPLQRYTYIIEKDAPVHLDRWQIAQEINKFTDENSKLIVLGEYSKHVGGYDLSPVLYYYTDLQGWTLTPESWRLEKIQELINSGATHLVVLLPYGYPYDFIYLPEESYEPFLQQLKANFPVIFEQPDQIVFDLR